MISMKQRLQHKYMKKTFLSNCTNRLQIRPQANLQIGYKVEKSRFYKSETRACINQQNFMLLTKTQFEDVTSCFQKS